MISDLGFEPHDISPKSGDLGLGTESKQVNNQSVSCAYMRKSQKGLWTGHSDELLGPSTLPSHASMLGRPCVPRTWKLICVLLLQPYCKYGAFLSSESFQEIIEPDGGVGTPKPVDHLPEVRLALGTPNLPLGSESGKMCGSWGTWVAL